MKWVLLLLIILFVIKIYEGYKNEDLRDAFKETKAENERLKDENKLLNQALRHAEWTNQLKTNGGMK